jgi:hypothetical protein
MRSKQGLLPKYHSNHARATAGYNKPVRGQIYFCPCIPFGYFPFSHYGHGDTANRIGKKRGKNALISNISETEI